MMNILFNRVIGDDVVSLQKGEIAEAKLIVLNDLKYTISAPILIKNITVNRASPSFNCSQTYGNATLQKQWFSSEFLKYYVHVSA